MFIQTVHYVHMDMTIDRAGSNDGNGVRHKHVQLNQGS